MKTPATFLAAAALSGLVFAQSNPSSAPASTAATAEHQPLARWLGDWAYQTKELDSPLGNASTTLGSRSVQPVTNTQPASMDAAQGEPLQRIETDGMDPARGTFFWSSFAGNRPVLDPVYSFDGSRATMVGTLLAGDRRFRVRSIVTFAEDFQSLTDKREISADGVHWNPLSESRATRITPVLAAPDSDEEPRGAMDDKCLPNSLPPE